MGPKMGGSKLSRITTGLSSGWDVSGVGLELVLTSISGIPVSSRRKSEAAAYLDEDSITRHHKGGNQREEKLNQDHSGPIFESRARVQ